MKVGHHPSEGLWLDYASGQLDGASRRILESHLSVCTTCRNSGLALASPAEGFFSTRPAPPPPPSLLASLLAQVRRTSPAAGPTVGSERLPIPAAFWPTMPQLPSKGWRGALCPGFRYLAIPQPEGTHLYLIHLRRGRRFPRHGHAGVERSVVLCGGLRDAEKTFEPGDFDEASLDHIHRPQALPDEDCWLLASLQGTLQFTGWRGWLQALMT